jgi:hypothetical protein
MRIFLVLAVAFTVTPPALADTSAPGKPSREWSENEPPEERARTLLEILISNQDLQLNEENACDKERLGQYIARLIAYGGDKSSRGRHRLSATCETKWKKNYLCSGFFSRTSQAGAAMCALDSAIEGGESPWHYSFCFFTDKKTSQLDRRHYSCPGLP